MKILKFGGTSVGSASGIRNVKEIIAAEEGEKIIVLSAMAGVTNLLVHIITLIKAGEIPNAKVIVEQLKKKHLDLVDELIPVENFSVKDQIIKQFEKLSEILHEDRSENTEARILTFGEVVSTFIVSRFFENEGIANTLLDARKFMQVSNIENPDTDKVSRLLHQYLKDKSKTGVYITQGFVRVDKFNRINTLKRGGSDFTATILGAAVGASEIQIWTDIDGFHNNDPRYVENTHSLTHLTFEEAAELAYFGAKILHPQTVSPVIGKTYLSI